MRYLGSILGDGTLKSDGNDIGRASYEFEVFFETRTGMTSCGEIRLHTADAEDLFSRKDIQLFTDDGFLLDLKYSGKIPLPTNDIVHVDVIGGLPAASSFSSGQLRKQISTHAQARL